MTEEIILTACGACKWCQKAFSGHECTKLARESVWNYYTGSHDPVAVTLHPMCHDVNIDGQCPDWEGV